MKHSLQGEIRKMLGQGVLVSCADPRITRSRQVNPPPAPSEEGSREATLSRDATLSCNATRTAPRFFPNASVRQLFSAPSDSFFALPICVFARNRL